MAELLKGAPVAARIGEETARRASALRERGVVPTLAILRVGENEADLSYERGARKRCEAAGVECRVTALPADASEERVLAEIDRLNRDGSVHGVLIFRPLPKHISDRNVCSALRSEKDVDGITDGSLAGVFTGRGMGFCPCTAQAVTEILDFYGFDCTGKRAVVLGRSLVIGKPVSQLLLARNATVTVCHTRTRSLAEETRRADLVVAAVGHAGAFRAEHAASGQVVVDVGINVNAEGKLCGDADFPSVEPIISAITPVPGGVGSVTTSVLVRHVAEAAERSLS